jgi:hypothetical protein
MLAFRQIMSKKIFVKILKRAKNIEKCGIIFYANIR